MKIFAYALRDFDEQYYFESMCKNRGIEYGFTSAYPSKDNAELARGFDALSIITNPMNKDILDIYKSIGIKYISTRSIGYDHIDVEYANKIGIRIAHAFYDPNSVANYTIMMMLMGCRKILPIMERAKIQDYSLKGKSGKEISDCVIGVIGTGKIGTKVIEHLSGFECKILAYDIYQNDKIKKYAQYTDLDTLYSESDIITLHAPANAENYHMINKGTFEKMKDGVMIVNNARGALINTDDMIEAIENGKIGYAALDTIENESGLYYLNRKGDIIQNHDMAILSAFPNVMLSPHTAFYTERAVKDMVDNSIKGLLNFEENDKNEFEVETGSFVKE